MIHYNKIEYNCAHYAVERLNALHGLSIAFSSGDEWQVQFIKMLREMFTPIDDKKQGCLVVMSNHDASLHLGVYNGSHVEHNYNTEEGSGSVILSDMGTIRVMFKRVRYYEINKKVS